MAQRDCTGVGGPQLLHVEHALARRFQVLKTELAAIEGAQRATLGDERLEQRRQLGEMRRPGLRQRLRVKQRRFIFGEHEMPAQNVEQDDGAKVGDCARRARSRDRSMSRSQSSRLAARSSRMRAGDHDSGTMPSSGSA